MKMIRNFLFIAFCVFVFVAPVHADSGKKIHLSDSVKATLIAAKPVQGAGVKDEAFNGRPVLVTFFASW
jgi:large-conductance mechanosensitive channel